MPRFFFIGIFVIVITATAFFYKTRPSPVLLMPVVPIAEFGGVSLRLEYATTTSARILGLGGRESIPSDYGMLFVFTKDDYYGFWMKGMLVPIDIFWLDIKGHVVSMTLDVSTSTYPNVFYPSAPAWYVLETIAGFARAHRIATGTPLVLKNSPSISK